MLVQVLRGARAGASLSLDAEPIRVGRDPDSELRFDPEGDLEVSARHALLFRAADRWVLRDLGSTNGTFLNGRRIDADLPVHSGDRIEFGAGGPVIEVRFDAGVTVTRTQELRAQYAARHRRLGWIVAALGIALVGASVALVAVSRAGRRERLAAEAERAQLHARIDSLLVQGDNALASLRGEMEGLADALRRSRAEVEEVRAALDRLPAGGGAPAEELERQLRAATEALKRQQLAATLDFRAIERSNRRAVALVFVEAQDASVATATAFAVRPDGTLLTAAHLLAGADGSRRPRRIAVQFSDSEQFFPARLLRIAEGADIAAIAVENLIGAVPVITGFNLRADTIGAGAPVALIGFPLGGETAMPGAARSAARPLVTAGIVTAVAADRLEVRGYGAAGASGSPIFDGDGRVLGILFGGRTENGQSVVVAAPARAATDLLERIR